MHRTIRTRSGLAASGRQAHGKKRHQHGSELIGSRSLSLALLSHLSGEHGSELIGSRSLSLALLSHLNGEAHD